MIVTSIRFRTDPRDVRGKQRRGVPRGRAENAPQSLVPAYRAYRSSASRSSIYSTRTPRCEICECIIVSIIVSIKRHAPLKSGKRLKLKAQAQRTGDTTPQHGLGGTV